MQRQGPGPDTRGAPAPAWLRHPCRALSRRSTHLRASSQAPAVMPLPGAVVKGIEARRLERGIREQRPGPGGDSLLEGRGSAVRSLESVCLPVQAAYCKSVGVLPDEAIIQTENWGRELASALGAQGICNMRKLQGRSPRVVGLGSWAGKTRSHPVIHSPPVFCQTAPPSSRPSTGKTLLCFVNHP